MELHRTTRCGGFGHREFTLILSARSPVPDVHRILIDYFEDAVAEKTRFEPGETVQLGWATLRLVERGDGTLGVEERDVAPEPRWMEQVDRALRDVWYQREIVDSVGLDLDFPHQEQSAMAADCALDGPVLLSRIADPAAPPSFSGWVLRCPVDHDHGDYSQIPLLAIASLKPSLVQLLALPRGTTVLATYREPSGRIAPYVYRGKQEVAPRPGSYLASLQAS